jgi:hypothetical protein
LSNYALPLSSLFPLAEALPAEEAARDRALTSLVHRLANAASLPPEVAALTLRLARNDLLDLHSGLLLDALRPGSLVMHRRNSPLL